MLGMQNGTYCIRSCSSEVFIILLPMFFVSSAMSLFYPLFCPSILPSKVTCQERVNANFIRPSLRHRAAQEGAMDRCKEVRANATARHKGKDAAVPRRWGHH